MSYFGDKPSSRVLRPPGGGSSNIFGGCDEPTAMKKSPVPKPTYHSTVFESEPADPRPTSRTGSSASNTSDNIFGTASDNNNVVSNQKKISKTQQSSIFSEPDAAAEQQKKAAARRDPITGEFRDEGPAPQDDQPGGPENGSKENGDLKDAAADTQNLAPHLGPVRNTSGVRCAQPPGGKSSISFG